MRLAVVTALHRRARLARMVMEHVRSLDVSVEIVPVAAYSWDDPERNSLYNVHGWTYVEAPNMPISDKFCAASMALERLDVDAMMVIGSDDFINSAYVESVVKRLREGAHYIMPQSLYFYDALNVECFYARARRVGAGRTLSREVLEELAWRPWRSGFMQAVDRSMDGRIEMMANPPDLHHIKDIREEGGLILDVKTGVNMWNFETMQDGLDHDVVDAREVITEYLPEYAEELLSW